MNKNLCVLPFINLSTRPTGAFKICSEGCHEHMPELPNLNNVSIDEFWNHDNLKKFRKDMLDNKTLPYCDVCNHIEENNGTSKRNSVNRKFLEKYQHIIDYAKENNGEVPTSPVQWEIRLSSKCNLACLMCSPTNSTVIESQHTKNFNSLSQSDKNLTINAKKLSSKLDTSFIDQIWDHIEHIDQIELHGGEPFYDEKCLLLLEKIIEKLPNNNIKLLVHTNMSFMNDRIISILNGFKEVNFQMSIDGLDKENEFIRWPSQWKVIEENLKIVDTRLTTTDNLVCVAVTPYNCLTLDCLLSWVLENYPNFSMHWFPVQLPKRSNLSLVPLADRQLQVEKLKKLKPICSKDISKNLDKIIKYLLKDDLNDQQLINEFVEYAMLMDKIRKQNTLEMFPHLKSIFDRYKR